MYIGGADVKNKAAAFIRLRAKLCPLSSASLTLSPDGGQLWTGFFRREDTGQSCKDNSPARCAIEGSLGCFSCSQKRCCDMVLSAFALPGHGTAVSAGAGMRNRKFFGLFFLQEGAWTGFFRKEDTGQSCKDNSPARCAIESSFGYFSHKKALGQVSSVKKIPGRAVKTTAWPGAQSKVLLVIFLIRKRLDRFLP